MRSTCTCRICKYQNYLKDKEDTRANLQMKIGNDKIDVNCGKLDEKHINRITMVVDSRIVVFGVILGMISTVLLWKYLGAIATFTFSLPIVFWRYESKQAHKFNSYAIKRK